MARVLGNLAIGRVLDLVYPRFCLRCKSEGTAWCAACAANFSPVPPAPRCPFCHAEGSPRTCAGCRPHASLDGLAAFAPYGNAVVREALTGWKYHGDPEYGCAVAGWIRQFAATRDVEWLRGAAVTHVPLHDGRRRHRGFDQAEEIARVFADAIGAEFRPMLARVEATSPQAARRASDRLVGDLDHAFRALGPVPRRVVLCDDVATSGATIDAAARALKAAGAERVWGFAVAVGG